MPILFIVKKGQITMKEIIKSNIKYLIFLFVFGLIGGYFTAIYSVQSLSPELLNEALQEIGSIDILYVVLTLQSVGYALILGIIGKILAKKIGLWRKLEFSKKAIIEILLVTILGGIVFIMTDNLIFNNYSEVIKNSYSAKPTVEYIIASLTYGGVVEEIMLRLFFMSLIAFIIQKISKREEMNIKILPVTAGLTKFLPVPPKSIFTTITANVLPKIGAYHG